MTMLTSMSVIKALKLFLWNSFMHSMYWNGFSLLTTDSHHIVARILYVISTYFCWTLRLMLNRYKLWLKRWNLSERKLTKNDEWLPSELSFFALKEIVSLSNFRSSVEKCHFENRNLRYVKVISIAFRLSVVITFWDGSKEKVISIVSRTRAKP